jgi:hypothetical protein
MKPQLDNPQAIRPGTLPQHCRSCFVSAFNNTTSSPLLASLTSFGAFDPRLPKHLLHIKAYRYCGTKAGASDAW